MRNRTPGRNARRRKEVPAGRSARTFNAGGNATVHRTSDNQMSRTPRPPADVTAPAEDYLKIIYELERSGDPATTNGIAARLSLSPASVSGMIRRLAAQGLLDHERYHGVRLTDDGRRIALRIVRRHRIIEAYLTGALGYDWDSVHDEAERLEHAASDDLVDRMAAAIGEPDTDPHGAPIPTREGRIVERAAVALDLLHPGDRARVLRVSDDDGERLRYVARLGLTPGARLEVLEREPFGGTWRLRVAGREEEVTIGAALAAVIETERDG